MLIHCPEPCVVCPPGLDAGDNPFLNLSSEAPDVNLFYGYYWLAPWCLGVCTSTISQEDANLCAARKAVEQCRPNPPDPPQPPDVPPDPDDPRNMIFYNQQQTCTVNCPDGLTFSYT